MMGGIAPLVVAAELIQEEEDEHFQLMMEAARLAANEWMEMEEGIGLDELDSWEYVTVNIDDYHNMNDRVFRLHFRMSKAIFGRLVETLQTHLEEVGRLRRLRTPMRDIVLMVVWLLATPDTFRSVALRFGVRPSTLYYFYSYIIQALRELAPRYIFWPDEEERNHIHETFRRASGFPNVVCCIDGTHVYVTAPVENAAAYRNRFQTYSLVVQAACDSTLLIRDFSVGEPGSLNDNRVFRRSDLCQDILEGRRLGPNEHLLGDGAYTLTDFMMIPFPHIQPLTEEQMIFNRALSQCRARIENAFGRAKGKWRRLKFMHVRNHQAAVDHITASFVLHNFTIREGEQLIDEAELMRPVHDEEVLGNENFADEDENLEGNFDPALMEAAIGRGREKQLHIMRHLVNLRLQ